MNRAAAKTSWTRWMSGAACGVAAGAGFWWLIASRVTLPAWQLSVLPAALFGMILGRAVPQRGRLRLAFALGGAILLALLGEITRCRADLQRTIHHAKSAKSPKQLQQQIAIAVAQRDAQKAQRSDPVRRPSDRQPGPNASAGASQRSQPGTEIFVVAQFYWSRWDQHWFGLTLSLLLSSFSAVQAARIFGTPSRGPLLDRPSDDVG